MAKLEIHQFPCLSDNFGVLIHDAERRHGLHRCARRQGRRRRAAGQGLDAHAYPHHASSRRPHRRQPGAQGRDQVHHHRPARGGGQDPRHRQAGGRGRHVHASARTRCGCSIRPATPPATSPTGFPRPSVAFVGDTLFAIGCGRVIEGNAADDVGVAAEADGAAEGHDDLLRPRVHAGQRQVRAHHRARERGAAEARQGGRRSCAPPASRRCRPRIGLELETNPFLRPTCRPSRSGSAWSASPSGRSSARSASARTAARSPLVRRECDLEHRDSGPRGDDAAVLLRSAMAPVARCSSTLAVSPTSCPRRRHPRQVISLPSSGRGRGATFPWAGLRPNLP